MQHLSLEPSAVEVQNLQAMNEIFAEVLGLRRLVHTTSGMTFELGTDNDGHTHVLMLLAASAPVTPRIFNIEVANDEFGVLCQRLEHYCHLLEDIRIQESTNSMSHQCAWRVATCRLPEGHYLRLAAIDPSRCAPLPQNSGPAESLP
ncbi:glyoxalase/bleomycin resistance/dioxygenase family protein [Halomonas huangheensis]|uniref:VOC domain-containing protein n=1 Tax=Halomonas huangheensis TaxID=1178482 RepID=W1N1Z8_9GAMM|nr:glyoxalase/bleomycin resistance/dioxygenase family protein [Halomonas huangheensis]ALM51195.1 hypothetical protein AR456_01965 [Halomonas huangheensis]ERL49612.1 hypothetical protein BJB45_00405 [Halomonas huangheensis]